MRKGFTLIELIVVVAIIFLLSAIVFTALKGKSEEEFNDVGKECAQYRYKPLEVAKTEVPKLCRDYFLKGRE